MFPFGPAIVVPGVLVLEQPPNAGATSNADSESVRKAGSPRRNDARACARFIGPCLCPKRERCQHVRRFFQQFTRRIHSPTWRAARAAARAHGAKKDAKKMRR